jgi:hypothetical protein
VQGAAYAAAVARAIADENARAAAVFIVGATGPYAEVVNGFFEPKREENGLDGRVIYMKRGDDSVRIEHCEGDWEVAFVGRNCQGRELLAFVSGLCALESCVSRVWRVLDEEDGYAVQPSVKMLISAAAVARAIADENARAAAVFIVGATGPYAEVVNGFFEPKREENGLDGRVIYMKRGDDGVRIEHFQGNWQVAFVGRNCRALVSGLCALESCVSRVWRVLDEEDGYADQPSVKMLIGVEAELQVIGCSMPQRCQPLFCL